MVISAHLNREVEFGIERQVTTECTEVIETPLPECPVGPQSHDVFGPR